MTLPYDKIVGLILSGGKTANTTPTEIKMIAVYKHRLSLTHSETHVEAK